jgi:hypothetical protein
MAQPVIQTSFNSGEWAPALNARVDLAKYHSGAALLRNFFVDYRGGATTRPGTRYVLQSHSPSPVRIIGFQASLTVSYLLEFGAIGTSGYVAFYNNGAPVANSPLNITGVTNANPCVVTVANTYTTNDRVFISGLQSTIPQLNGNWYNISARTAGSITLADLNGNPVDSTSFGVYVSGGTTQSQYGINSPYQTAELAGLKFVQNVNTLIITHPNHPPYVLTLISATNWTLAPITFGATIAAPATPSVATTLAAGSVNYAYVVTSVDSNGQESAPSAFGILASILDIRNNAGTNTVTWAAVTGAASYNVYKAEPRYSSAVPAGATFGFIGNVTGTTFIDSGITQDFSQGPPVALNPFSGSGVQSVSITAAGSYTPSPSGLVVPSVSFSGGGGSGAAATVFMQCTSFTISTGGFGYIVGQVYFAGIQGVQIQCTSIGSGGSFTGGVIVNAGSISGSLGGNDVNLTGGGVISFAHLTLTYGVSSVGITSPGTGYSTPPTVTFSSGGATATSALGAASAGNPTVPTIFQQRLGLMAPVQNPQLINFSDIGSLYNFNVNSPIEADNAISGTLSTGRLNTIQSAVPMPQGLIVLTDQQAYLLNGGSPGSAITPLPGGLVANAHAYNGASYPPPIVANDNILYVQAKGSIVRDLVFNYYTQVYTGADISVLSSHLFYGFSITQWAWAEEPFKVVWADRSDGTLLSLTFLKEQELIAWTHSDTQGSFQSIATITEQTAVGFVDAIYHVVQRHVNGNTVQYIERFVELNYPQDYISSWQVDAGIGYSGAAATTFYGAQHLAGMAVTGLADGVVINFTMPTSGIFVFGPGGTTGLTGIANASVVTVGLSFLPQLQTLQLDLGEPTVQGKRKKITGVTTRVRQALGLSIGRTFAATSQTPMKDLVIGNVGTMSNTKVTGLVTGDARTIIDPLWDVPGQYCIQQSLPYPASILGVIPEIEVGDKDK